MPSKASIRAARAAVREVLQAAPTGDITLPMGSRQLDEERLKVVIRALADPEAAWSRLLLGRHKVGSATRDLAAVLCRNSTITELELSECKVKDSGLRALRDMLLANTSLRALDISGNFFQSPAVSDFFGSVARSQALTTLAFKGNRVDGDCSEAIGAALASCPSLTSLDLSDCGFDNQAVSWRRRQQCLMPLCRGIAASPAIKTLVLERNNWGPESAKLLAEAVASASSLTCLRLSGNLVKNAGAARLAEAIAVHPRMKGLYLASASVGDPGAEALADMLVQSTSLQTLVLADNPLRDGAAQAFGEALLDSRSIQRLDLSGGEFRVGAIEGLSQALATGVSLRHLACGGPCASLGGMGLLSSALQSNWHLESLSYAPVELSQLAQGFLVRNIQAQAARRRIRRRLGDWRTAINVGKYKRYLRRKGL